MTSWFLFAAAGAPEGGLFDLDATLPLMAIQVVVLTFILNALFFRPVGRNVEARESFLATTRTDAKQKVLQAQRLEADLSNQLKEARQKAQSLVVDAEEEMDKLYRAALASAQAEANASREVARREIDRERKQALGQLKADAELLGDQIVQRLLAAT
ncbi:F0F1 ATP synthase subunit B' [Synechococcus sp. CS-1325]|uniref:F0F1 ATP synthase subunit B' n=1 Tax=unclassified Synechococcus TaxID=2626047 RepID=UPI000DB79607|nr:MULTISPECIES: F0F1 ATP synthase subunit B' [unclassified Synechococcus]PZV01210.1 MAG: F0F1 ATP synthase subunit B' [Cyanobium sp.]MCT0200742.1 F0F1 ATP synthase subunit B' [Synechococcus sp. CS-1325]MCT0212317.1 F0F1 ATP synthase subunit B' [Synechococcus sp. CS-1326]MCT0230588.1 F0F1 ATP synthase subunit B' [Synechococcus sp. CS-1324]MCT0234270.1 F0F1 ATP synthase subunit B' [Synechococcus sp. CS-1327]